MICFRIIMDNIEAIVSLEDLINGYCNQPCEQKCGNHTYCEVKRAQIFIINGNEPDRFTGEKDRNGNNLFVNDVVRSIHTDLPYIIKYGRFKPCDVCEAEDDCYNCDRECIGFYTESTTGTQETLSHAQHWSELLGNVHQNQELAEKFSIKFTEV